MTDRCRQGHVLTDKTVRTRRDRPGVRDCKVCESERYREKYRCDEEFRRKIQAKNLKRRMERCQTAAT